ncbi:MAG TPA: glycine cleavage system protein GcvH [Alphaproteobacteria bacterium]|nr:glycine cleavage system protein GcvH [Alphaproteobacteria bacterium]
MSAVKFTKDHEWARLEGNIATVGITEYAQHALGDIVYVELPEAGKKLQQGKEAAVVESVKAASDVYAPLSGEVIEVNEGLKNDPAAINVSPEDRAWFFKMKIANPGEFDALMDASAYKKHTGE